MTAPGAIDGLPIGPHRFDLVPCPLMVRRFAGLQIHPHEKPLLWGEGVEQTIQ